MFMSDNDRNNYNAIKGTNCNQPLCHNTKKDAQNTFPQCHYQSPLNAEIKRF